MVKHAAIWKDVTIDAMSLDEGEATGNKPCTVFNDLWRNPEVKIWVDTHSRLYYHTRWNGVNYGRGPLPRRRVQTSRIISHRHAPIGLPFNFYNPDWYNSLDPVEQRRLEPKPAVDLSFSPRISR